MDGEQLCFNLGVYKEKYHADHEKNECKVNAISFIDSNSQNRYLCFEFRAEISGNMLLLNLVKMFRVWRENLKGNHSKKNHQNFFLL